MRIEDTSNPFSNNPSRQFPPRPAQQWRPLWWIAGGFAVVMLICCGGIGVGVMYIGIAGPETSVYVGNQVPERFLSTAREVGALDDDEKVRFFYSDSLVNIREGFYFVSDRKVAIYIEDGRETPLISVAFDDIASANISRDESFFEDSQIMIETTDGELIAFPVSSEFDRDEAFFKAIEEKIQ